jgi:aminoglycoside phosphotransferase
MQECPVSVASLQAWLAARGLGGRTVEPMPGDACVNWVAAVGDDLVVRVCRLPDDCYTERVAVPIAVAAGLRTPRLLDFDDSMDPVPSVVTLYERWPGVALGLTRTGPDRLEGVYNELGRELALLHSKVTEADDPHHWLEVPEAPDPEARLREAAAEGTVDAPTEDWIAQCLERIRPYLGRPRRQAFVHNDAHAFNTLVVPAGYSGIIDWGDAGWDDPAAELSSVPLFAVPWCLAGYEAAGGELDPGFHARVLWNALDQALGWEHEGGAHPWSMRPGTLWANLARLLADPGAGPWRDLLGGLV